MAADVRRVVVKVRSTEELNLEQRIAAAVVKNKEQQAAEVATFELAEMKNMKEDEARGEAI